jgi:VanZ family protein
LTILWMGIIFYFSSQNGELSSLNNQFIFKILQSLGLGASTIMNSDVINFLIRKIAHLTEYFILGILLYKTYRGYIYGGFEVIAILTGFIYACSDEFHQSFVPGRSPAVRDVVIDTTGVILGVLFILFCFYRIRKERHIWN